MFTVLFLSHIIFWSFDIANFFPEGRPVRSPKTGNVKKHLFIFICLHSDINADRNLNLEGSAEKLVALVLLRRNANITDFEIICHCRSQEENTWVHCWAWCPVTCCQPKPGALLGIMPSNRLHSACNPHALLGMMPSNVRVLPGTDTLLGMMPSNVPFLGCKSALCWAWCPATSPAMRKLCQERLWCHRT